MTKTKEQVTATTKRIVVVDDHPLIREGFAARISTQADLQICGEAVRADEAMRLVQETHPDLVIVDIALEESHGLDLIKDIHKRFPEIKILVVSAFDESLYAERTLRAGAHGYINKRKMQDEILQAIRTILAGERYLSSQMTQRLLDQAVHSGDPIATDPITHLSDRELEVFQLIGHGKSTAVIADQLFLSPHTIDTYREKIRHKLGIKNSAELMQRAVQWVLERGGY